MGKLKKSAAVILVLLLLILAGIAGEKKMKPGEDAELHKTGNSEMSENQQEKAPEESEQENDHINETMQEIYDLIAWQKYEEAALYVRDHTEQLEYMWFDKWEKTDHFYNGKETELLSGQNMENPVLAMHGRSTFYYGTLKDGVLDGTGILLAFSFLNENLRYDYAEGTWNMGKLCGAGTSGYVYCVSDQSISVIETEKKGDFSENLLDGSFTYRSINREKEESSWTMEAKNGVTVYGDRWGYEKEKDRYILPSDTDATHGYIIPSENKDEVMWTAGQEW